VGAFFQCVCLFRLSPQFRPLCWSSPLFSCSILYNSRQFTPFFDCLSPCLKKLFQCDPFQWSCGEGSFVSHRALSTALSSASSVHGQFISFPFFFLWCAPPSGCHPKRCVLNRANVFFLARLGLCRPFFFLLPSQPAVSPPLIPFLVKRRQRRSWFPSCGPFGFFFFFCFWARAG